MSQLKNEIITTKVTPAMKSKIIARSEQLDVNVAEYIRQLIQADLKEARDKE